MGNEQSSGTISVIVVMLQYVTLLVNPKTLQRYGEKLSLFIVIALGQIEIIIASCCYHPRHISTVIAS
jgi:hypothetical protein